jgi:hypothetical protein
VYVRLDGAFGDVQSGGDGPVGHALGDQPEDLSFPLAEAGEGVGPAAASDQARDDRGVDHRFAVHDAAQGVDDGGDVEDAFLEQVANPFGLHLDEAHGVAGLHVLGQDQDADLGVLGADRLGGDQALVGVGWRHADVDQRHVRASQADLPEQTLGVFGLGDHLDAGIAQQPDDALPGEQDVVGDDYAHGSSARSRVGSTASRPSRAPMRSASWTIAAVRVVPSSSTVTTSRSPS